MRILLSGGTGFVGQKLGQELARKGHDLIVLTRDPKSTAERLSYPAKAMSWDEIEQITAVDAVVHLAGESVGKGRWTATKKRQIQESRVTTTEALVTACKRLQPKVWVSSSAIGWYGDRGDDICVETDLASKEFLAETCRLWEAASQGLPASTRRVILRLGVVLGEGGGALSEMIPVFQKGLGAVLGSGEQWMSWVHIDDVVQIFVSALENSSDSGRDSGWSGIFNVVAPEPARNREFTQALAQALKVRTAPAVPAFVLRMVVGEFAETLLTGQKVSAEKVQELGFRFRFPKLNEAMSAVAASHAGCQIFLAEQWVPHSVDEVFDFFTDAKNLEQITPEFLNFHVEKSSSESIEEGTLIDYVLRIHGVPVRWQSRIENWQPGKSFVDTQVRGPYSLWHHTHEFEVLCGGTLLRDRVRYRVPLGWIGKIFAGAFVDSDVRKIFNFRRQAIAKKFSAKSNL